MSPPVPPPESVEAHRPEDSPSPGGAHDGEGGLRVSCTSVARTRTLPPARDGTAAAVAKPSARALVDVNVRRGAACRAAGRDSDRIAVLYRIRSAIRPGHPW